MATQQNPEPATVPERNNHQESRSTRIINRSLYAMAMFSIAGLLAMSLPLERMLQPPDEARQATQEEAKQASQEEAKQASETDEEAQPCTDEEEQPCTEAQPTLTPAARWITRSKVAILLLAAFTMSNLLIAHRFAAGWQSFTERPVHTTVNMLATLAEHPTGLPLRLIIRVATAAWDRCLHPVLNRARPVIGDFIMFAFLQERINSERENSRAEGRAEGRVEGIAEGRAEGEAIGRVEGIAEGIAKGEAIGRAEGEAIGEARGRAEGVADLLDQMVREGLLTPEQRAEKEAQYRADYPAQDSNHDRE